MQKSEQLEAGKFEISRDILCENCHWSESIRDNHKEGKRVDYTEIKSVRGEYPDEAISFYGYPFPKLKL